MSAVAVKFHEGGFKEMCEVGCGSRCNHVIVFRDDHENLRSYRGSSPFHRAAKWLRYVECHHGFSVANFVVGINGRCLLRLLQLFEYLFTAGDLVVVLRSREK